MKRTELWIGIASLILIAGNFLLTLFCLFPETREATHQAKSSYMLLVSQEAAAQWKTELFDPQIGVPNIDKVASICASKTSGDPPEVSDFTMSNEDTAELLSFFSDAEIDQLPSLGHHEKYSFVITLKTSVKHRISVYGSDAEEGVLRFSVKGIRCVVFRERGVFHKFSLFFEKAAARVHAVKKESVIE